jgi:hypothetical protein
MLQKTQRLYESGPFVLDTMQHALLRNGQPVRLAPKTYDTLLILACPTRAGGTVGIFLLTTGSPSLHSIAPHVLRANFELLPASQRLCQ